MDQPPPIIEIKAPGQADSESVSDSPPGIVINEPTERFPKQDTFKSDNDQKGGGGMFFIDGSELRNITLDMLDP